MTSDRRSRLVAPLFSAALYKRKMHICGLWTEIACQPDAQGGLTIRSSGVCAYYLIIAMGVLLPVNDPKKKPKYQECYREKR